MFSNFPQVLFLLVLILLLTLVLSILPNKKVERNFFQVDKNMQLVLRNPTKIWKDSLNFIPNSTQPCK